jgi:4-hydroxy-tetrahydrodipicolinate synthase
MTGGLFRGLSAFPLTPTDEKGVVDTETLGRLVARLADAGVASIGVLGSTGGFMYLERAERRRAVAAAVEAAGGRTPVIAGAGALRTDEACALAQDAEAEGADALLLAPVSYIPLKDDEVFAHVSAVAGATGLPVCLYNNPTTTHFTFSRDLLARLADVPGVSGAKMPLPADGDVATDLAGLDRSTGGRIAIGYSGDPGLANAMLGGAGGFYSALAGILPREVRALYAAAASGDAAPDLKFQPMWALFRAHGGFRVIPEIARVLGLADMQPPRPVLPLPPAARSELGAALDALRGI